MKVDINGHEVVLYDAPEDMPIVRFHKFSKYMLIESGVGSDMAAMDRHIAKLIALNTKGNRDELDTELRNMRQCMAMMYEGFDGKSLALASLVKSVDGKARDDISEEGLRETAKMFSEVSIGRLTEWLLGIKKKIDAELTAYFPKVFGTAAEAEYEVLYKKRLLAILDGIIEGRDTDAEVQRIEDEMVLLDDVQAYWNGEFEVRYDRQFEDMCLGISGELHTDAKRMSVMEYYSAYELLDRRGKEMKKRLKKR